MESGIVPLNRCFERYQFLILDESAYTYDDDD